MKAKLPEQKETSQPVTQNMNDNLLFSPSEIYHENSKLRHSDMQLYTQIYLVNSSPHIRRIISRPFTKYRGHSTIKLSTKFAPTTKTFEEIMTNRRSQRSFSGKSLSLDSLSKILYMGDGSVQTMKADDDSVWSLRTAPSAGGLYPIEVSCVALNIDNLPPGLHFYDPINHSLTHMLKEDLVQALANAMPAFADAITNASCCFLLSALMPRIKFKYGKRGYRFALLEAGHIAQNLLLAAEAEGEGACPIGGFIDDDLNSLLHLDGLEEVVLYAVLIGSLS